MRTSKKKTIQSRYGRRQTHISKPIREADIVFDEVEVESKSNGCKYITSERKKEKNGNKQLNMNLWFSLKFRSTVSLSYQIQIGRDFWALTACHLSLVSSGYGNFLVLCSRLSSVVFTGAGGLFESCQ